jgi:hypothetical protein
MSFRKSGCTHKKVQLVALKALDRCITGRVTRNLLVAHMCSTVVDLESHMQSMCKAVHCQGLSACGVVLSSCLVAYQGQMNVSEDKEVYFFVGGINCLCLS